MATCERVAAAFRQARLLGPVNARSARGVECQARRLRRRRPDRTARDRNARRPGAQGKPDGSVRNPVNPGHRATPRSRDACGSRQRRHSRSAHRGPGRVLPRRSRPRRRDLDARPRQLEFSPFWLDGWPRVADVEAADFNDDGKLDLAVAAFGYHKTGNISILENQITNPSRPRSRPM